MVSKWIIAIVLLATTLATSASTPTNPRLARFNEDFERTGETEDCVSLSRIHSTRVIDGGHILFRLYGNRYFLNSLPRNCPRLGYLRSFGYATSMSRLCHIDTITVIDDFTHLGGGAGVRVAMLSGPRCGLGKFERVEKVKKPAPAFD